MLLNYLTSIWRYVARNRSFTTINVLGLVIGMTAFMLIAQFVIHELSYDRFWRGSEQIYRVQLDRYNKGELSTRWAMGAQGIGPDLKADFPEVKYYTRLTSAGGLLAHGDAYFKEEYVYFASQDFFKVFNYPLLEGEDSSALKGLDKIVLSRSMAKKYFGDQNPMGQTLRKDGKMDFTVTGVFEDLPENSHMKIDALVSFATFARATGKAESELTNWNWDGFLTYLRLEDHTDGAALERKLPDYVHKKMGEELKHDNANMIFNLQAISDIHLDSNFIGEFKVNGNRDTTYFLLIVAVLILVIAWINYINLATAKSIERAREVGVRKVMGGFRTQLIQQFLIESLLLNIIAVTMAVTIVIILTPWFGRLTGRELGYTLFFQPMFWLGVVGLILGGALLSGLYPAFVLSSYKPVDVLKGRFKNTNRGAFFRKGMVITQFMASVTLIVGTFTVYQQINFMRSQSLGVKVEQTLIIHAPNNIVDSLYGGQVETLRHRLEQYPEVNAMAISTSVPGTSPGWNAGGIRRLSQREDEANQYRVIMMDHEFIPAYGLEVVAGRAFSGDVPKEHTNVMINESAVKLMGFQNAQEAIDDRIFFWGDTFRIVGVLKNYRQESVKKAYEPLVFRYNKTWGNFYSVKFKAANVQASINTFQNDWKAIFPGNAFSFFFLDDHYNKQYQADQQFGTVFGMFSALAIFIACLGLFGLSSLTALQRTKEIGVRKVLGASIRSILALVSKDYLVLMGIAIVCATPLSWWVMNSWLEAFASRIDLAWWIFALPSLVVILVALLTVSIHTLKAARTNPAKSLRYE
jgi:putative ABC transport system permease protein